MATTKMSVTTGVLAEEVLDVDVEIAERLSATLVTYQDLKLQRDLLDEAMKQESEKIFEEMQRLGVEKIVIDGQLGGVPCSIIRGTYSSLDKMKFVQLGGSLAMLENATVAKPKKPFLRIGAERKEKAD